MRKAHRRHWLSPDSWAGSRGARVRTEPHRFFPLRLPPSVPASPSSSPPVRGASARLRPNSPEQETPTCRPSGTTRTRERLTRQDARCRRSTAHQASFHRVSGLPASTSDVVRYPRYQLLHARCKGCQRAGRRPASHCDRTDLSALSRPSRGSRSTLPILDGGLDAPRLLLHAVDPRAGRVR